MGADKISDKDIEFLGINIVKRSKSGNRMLEIPEESLDSYIELIEEKLTKGFWNEVVSKDNIIFIFKFKDGHIRKYTLSKENEVEISDLCTKFMGEESDKKSVYELLSDNDFYHDLMVENYSKEINE